MKKYLLAGTLILSFLFFGCGESNSGSTSTTIGVAGSMAKFSISGDYLYTINGEQMDIFDISEASTPYSVSKIHLPFDIETLFAYKENLYIGGPYGMYIYDNSIPTQPTKIADFIHAQSCDPVVISNDVAYVTLNTGSSCSVEGEINQLEMVDVSDPANPTLIKIVSMWAPTGLGVDEETLFVCDGDSGLKVFDINQTFDGNTTDVDLTLLDSNNSINCYDLIPHQNNLVVSNGTNVLQFDYTSFPMIEMGKIK